MAVSRFEVTLRRLFHNGSLTAGVALKRWPLMLPARAFEDLPATVPYPPWVMGSTV